MLDEYQVVLGMEGPGARQERGQEPGTDEDHRRGQRTAQQPGQDGSQEQGHSAQDVDDSHDDPTQGLVGHAPARPSW